MECGGLGTWRLRGRGMRSTAAACWRAGWARGRMRAQGSARRTWSSRSRESQLSIALTCTVARSRSCESQLSNAVTYHTVARSLSVAVPCSVCHRGFALVFMGMMYNYL